MVAMIRGVVDALEVLADAADGDIHGTVVGLELTAGHLLEQLGTGLDLAGFSQKCSMARNSERGSLNMSPAGLTRARLLMSSAQPLNR